MTRIKLLLKSRTSELQRPGTSVSADAVLLLVTPWLQQGKESAWEMFDRESPISSF